MSDLLEVRGLKKYFKTPGGFLHAVDNVSFRVEKGRTVGLVGESGCGKSTLGRTIVGLLDATAGQVLYKGENITHTKGKARRQLRRNMQMIFQDPFSSLDPRMCVRELIAEPLAEFDLFRTRAELDARIMELMDTVGLAERLADSYPHELDGGRRQRIGIARALALGPEFIVCDEPVSALDVSIQAQILNLLMDLQENHDLTYIFITHDLSVVKHISDTIIVMYLGTVVEQSDADRLFENPAHPYTQGLLSAIPIPSLDTPQEEIILQGEISSPIDPKSGCRFAARCPHAQSACTEQMPPLQEIEPGHFVACIYAKPYKKDEE